MDNTIELPVIWDTDSKEQKNKLIKQNIKPDTITNKMMFYLNHIVAVAQSNKNENYTILWTTKGNFIINYNYDKLNEMLLERN